MSLAITGRPGPDPKIVDPAFVQPLLDLIRDGVPGYVAAESMLLRRESYFMYLRKGGHPRHAASKDFVPSVTLPDGRSIPDYTGVLRPDELGTGSRHRPYYYFGRFYDQSLV